MFDCNNYKLLIITLLLSSKPEECFWSNRTYQRIGEILIIKIAQISYRVSRRVNHHHHHLEDRRRRHLGHPVEKKII